MNIISAEYFYKQMAKSKTPSEWLTGLDGLNEFIHNRVQYAQQQMDNGSSFQKILDGTFTLTETALDCIISSVVFLRPRL